MHIDAIRELIQTDLHEVDQLITQQLDSPVELINQISKHIIGSGGKRLRPMLVLLGARAFEYDASSHIEIAAIIELIHTATLLHDDIVDSSVLRRGQQTANAVWGNAVSVLVGDFLYSRTFQMMVRVQSMPIMDVLSKATNTIAEGEVLQLLNRNNPDTTEEHYMNVIRYKTGTLFEAAAQLGAVLCERPLTEIKAMSNYGLHLGTAFQIVDDMLDYCATKTEIGKNIGDDLAEGKPTLPLLYALRHGTRDQKEIIHTAITQGSREYLPEILQAIESTGAIEYTHNAAQNQVKQAIKHLSIIPESNYRDALHALAQFAIARNH